MYNGDGLEVPGAYAEKRLAGLDETGQRDGNPKIDRWDRQAAPFGSRQSCSGRLRALDGKALGDVDVQYIWRFPRAQKIDLSARNSRCESSDLDFAGEGDLLLPVPVPWCRGITACRKSRPGERSAWSQCHQGARLPAAVKTAPRGKSPSST